MKNNIGESISLDHFITMTTNPGGDKLSFIEMSYEEVEDFLAECRKPKKKKVVEVQEEEEFY